MSGGKRKSEKGDGRGGGYFLLPHCLLNSEAFRSLSHRAKAILLAVCSKHDGFNNGAIGLGARELAELVDSQNHKANSKALCQLIERGFLTLEKDHPRGLRLAREYRLTFVNCGDASATNDYLHWKPGDAGTHPKRTTGNFRVEPIATRDAVSVAVASTGDETSRCGSLNGVHAKPPIFGRSPVEACSTHISNHLRGCPASPESSSKSPLSNGGPISSAPDPEELRGRVQAVLDDAERGSQGQLAALAKIRPAALSKFLNHGGPLNDESRLRLTLALPKVATGNLERISA